MADLFEHITAPGVSSFVFQITEDPLLVARFRIDQHFEKHSGDGIFFKRNDRLGRLDHAVEDPDLRPWLTLICRFQLPHMVFPITHGPCRSYLEKKSEKASCISGGIGVRIRTRDPVESHRQPENNAAAGQDLLLYTGVLVSFVIPRNGDTAVLDAAIANIKCDIEKSIERHLPPGCTAHLQNMA
jgi:hypothetical protein